MTLLIDSLDDDGFRPGLDEIAEALPEELDVEPEELQVAPRLLQTFEPAGTGARNVKGNACCCKLMYCLAPRRRRYWRGVSLPTISDLLAGKDYNRLKRLPQCSDTGTACGTGMSFNAPRGPGAVR